MHRSKSFASLRGFRPALLSLALAACYGGTFVETAGAAPAPASAGQAAAATFQFNLPAQNLGDALQSLAVTSQYRLLYSPELVQGRTSTALVGRYTLEEAVRRLLQGTGLAWELTADGLLLIHSATASAGSPSSASIQGVSQAKGDAVDTTRQALEYPADRPAPNNSQVSELASVEVTGTRIRGTDSVSPIGIYTNEDIERSGYATVQQFLQTLPQNFSGGQSDQAGNISGAVNFTRLGSGVNLRGLGNEATLVLLNGQRLAPAGTGNFVDVGMIPASAIERIEVLTDGASAIYGSDAVGGVVNFVLRTDYEGGDTRLRYGTVTSGNSAEYRASQTLGRAWSGGRVLGSYEFYRRGALDTESRAATRIAADPSDIFPSERRHSLLLHLEQRLSERLDLVMDGQYGKRRGEARDVDMLGQLSDYDFSQVQASGRLGLIADLQGEWKGEAFVSRARNENEVLLRIAGLASGALPSTASGVTALDVKADGPLAELPGGSVKAAVGGQLRKEDLTYDRAGVDQQREVRSVFGEISIPLIGAGNRRQGAERLTATAAVRHDRYDDFGSSTNTKFGLLWKPSEQIGVRATYGTSFRAPQLFDISRAADQVAATLVPDATGAPVIALLQVGSNPDLKPETARSWTLGMDFLSQSIPGLKATLSYYQIDYEDRITALAKEPRAFQALMYPSLFSPVITYDPSPAQVAALTAHHRFNNFSPLPTDLLPDNTRAVIDLRARNLAGTRSRGLDFGVAWQFGGGQDLFGVSLDGNYVLEHAQQLTPIAPWEDKVATVLNPVRYRLRSGFTWARAAVSAALFVNHKDAYVNDLIAPRERVDAWTTVDLNLRYQFGGGVARGVALSANIVNLFNQGPPFLTAVPPLVMNYDPSNADVLGRFVAVQLSKEW